jgi:hypothetical protein
MVVKKIIFVLATVCLIVFATSSVSFATDAVVNTNLKIEEDIIIKPSTKSMLGINDEWKSAPLYLGDQVSTKTSKRYLDMINSNCIPINQIRMSGYGSNNFYWKDSLGPMGERKNDNNLGLVEWIKSNMAVNPNVDFTFTINICNDTIENHADLVRFLTLMPEDENAIGSDGVNWAQRRIDLGIPEPVRIKAFELGNEVYHRYCDLEINPTPTEERVIEGVNNYIVDCKNAINAMVEVNPNIAFAVADFSYSKANAITASAWNSRLVESLGEECDYIVHHEYFFDYNFYWFEQQLKNRLFKYIDLIEESKRPAVYVSEYGYWMESAGLPDSMNWLPNGTSLFGTLTDAKFLNNLMNMKYVEMANIHTTFENISTAEQWGPGWDLFRIFDDGNIYATGPTEMLKIFNEAVGSGREGENVVKTTLSTKSDDNIYYSGYSNFPMGENTPVGLLTVSAHTTSDGGLNLILVNSNDTITHDITAEFKKGYKLKEEIILTSDYLTDNNIIGSPDILYAKRNLINSDIVFSRYTMPSKSIVVLKLLPINAHYGSEQKMLASFGNILNIKDDIPTVGNHFSLTCELYENKAMASMDNIILLIPKSDVPVENVIDNLAENMQNLYHIDQVKVKRNIAYFKVSLPRDTPPGLYHAIVGNLSDGRYEVVDFYYDSTDTTTKEINWIKFKNVTNYDELPFVSNDDYLVQAEILFGMGFEIGESCGIKVTRGIQQEKSDRETVNVGIIKASPGTIGNYDFYMPLDAISGNYTLSVEYLDLNGCKQEKNVSFYFNKPDEEISLITVPKNQEEQEITFNNISSASSVNFTVKSNSEKDISLMAILAFYESNDKLLTCAIDDTKTVMSGSTADISIILPHLAEIENCESILIFLWDKENQSPYSNVYYIK